MADETRFITSLWSARTSGSVPRGVLGPSKSPRVLDADPEADQFLPPPVRVPDQPPVPPDEEIRIIVHGGKASHIHPTDNRDHRLQAKTAALNVASPQPVKSPLSTLPSVRIGAHRCQPATTFRVEIRETLHLSSAMGTSLHDPFKSTPGLIGGKVGFISSFSDAPLADGTVSSAEDGGSVALPNDPDFVRFQTFRPGDFTFTVARFNSIKTVIMQVRADKMGVVGGAPLTRPTAGSKFFSEAQSEGQGGEGDDPEKIFAGRPIQFNRALRMINIGGERESPGFEDYQVDLDHSPCPDKKNGGIMFRPLTEDSDLSVFVAGASVSHITMRGVPFTPQVKTVVKRIAGAGCWFTFNGETKWKDDITSALGSKFLEPVMPDKSGGVLIALEIT